MISQPLKTPLAREVLPSLQPVVRSLLQVVVGTAFIALLAQVRLELGPVPLTGQTLGVLLVGAAYGLSLGTLTLVTYLIVGGLGFGVFAGGAAGWSVLSGSTGGYLVGFVLAAAVVGYLAQRGWDKRVGLAALAMLIGNIVIYIPGLLWLNTLAPDMTTTLQWGLIPFIPGDIIKLVLAAGLLPAAWQLLGKRSSH